MTIIEKFLLKISVADSGCWEWTAAQNHNGYGYFGVNGKMKRAHRFIYKYYYGVICPDLVIDHLCRNKIMC